MEEYPDTALFEAHRSFAATQHGQTLAARVRYERYNVANLPNEEWESLLGADVNNLKHMQLSFALAKLYIKHSSETMTAREQALLKLGLLIHDQGESIVGDISYSLKTAANELEEQAEFTRFQKEFCPDADEAFHDLLTEARDHVVFNDQTRLGAMRAAIEGMGYIRTTLRAHRQAGRETRPDVAAGMRWLVADVLGNMTGLVVTHVQNERSPLQAYFSAVQPDISAAFGSVQSADFDFYPLPDRDIKTQRFNDARQLWLSRPSHQEVA